MPTANYKGTLKAFPSCGRKLTAPEINWGNPRRLRNFVYRVWFCKGDTVEYTKDDITWWSPTCGQIHCGGWPIKYICQECAQKLGWEW